MHFTCVKQYGEYIVISEAGNESRFEVEWKFAALLHCKSSPSPFAYSMLLAPLTPPRSRKWKLKL